MPKDSGININVKDTESLQRPVKFANLPGCLCKIYCVMSARTEPCRSELVGIFIYPYHTLKLLCITNGFNYDQHWRDLKGCFIESNQNGVIRVFAYNFRIRTKKPKDS